MNISEHLTRDYEDPTESHIPHPQLILIYNTTPHDTHLARHPLPCQDCIYPMDLSKKVPHTTNVQRNIG